MIDDAVAADVPDIVVIAAARRAEFAVVQPDFAHEAQDALAAHTAYLSSLVDDPEVISLVARRGGRLVGYSFATLVEAPPIYDPGGPTGYVDDFAVADLTDWGTVGRDLLVETRGRLAARGVVQVVVVCGAHQREKREALAASGLGVVSEWWRSSIRGPGSATD